MFCAKQHKGRNRIADAGPAEGGRETETLPDPEVQPAGLSRCSLRIKVLRGIFLVPFFGRWPQREQSDDLDGVVVEQDCVGPNQVTPPSTVGRHVGVAILPVAAARRLLQLCSVCDTAPA